MKLHKIAWWLLVIGGLNWLLVAVLQKDLFGILGMDTMSWFPRLVYLLVGLSTLVVIFGKKGQPKPIGQMGM